MSYETAADAIEQRLASWNEALPRTIAVTDLLARNPLAYRWKAPLRSVMLRETVFWRIHDLITQSLCLHQQGHGLGARILLRSGFETIAVLIHLNQLMQSVLDGGLSFQAFGEKTSQMLLGSREITSDIQAINIMTILAKADKRYPGLLRVYADLSECAHPNYEGMMFNYSDVDTEEYITRFRNRWMEDSKDAIELMNLLIKTFDLEYNCTWPILIEQLEKWILKNESALDADALD